MGCHVHGPLAPCQCEYARKPGVPRGIKVGRRLRSTLIGLIALALSGCAALSSVTPADRAKAYSDAAAGVKAECKAYKFDRAAGLVPEVPAMAELCE